MSAHASDSAHSLAMLLTQAPLVAGISIFTTSLIGSLHCAGMCGPLYTALLKNPREQALYHLGRLISYSTLGALAGLLGNQIFSTLLQTELRPIGYALFALSLIFSLVMIWRPTLLKGFASLPRTSWILNLLSPVRKVPWLKAFTLGIATPLLPCSWLYGFLLASALTHEVWQGALVMFLFALGTIPHLVGVVWLRDLLLRLGLQRFQTPVTILVMCLALLTISWRMATGTCPMCH